MTRIVCGVDVSKAALDAHVGGPHRGTPGEAKRFANTPAGVATLAAWCKERQVTLVVMEASGGYERLALALLAEDGLGVALVNPRQVRALATALGLAEKSDPLDAAVIARFGEMRTELVATPPPSPVQSRLTALARRLAQITAIISDEKRRRATGDAIVQESVARLLPAYRAEAETLQAEIGAIINDDPLWSALDDAFRSIKGVSDRTIARLLADLPEIGTLSNKAVTKLVGLAPLINQSGSRERPRRTEGGRAGVRSILFVVAGIVARHHAIMAAFAQRLKQAGKPIMVVRIALAHKLLVWLNAKARDARKNIALAT